jgi:hypothetical protein
VDKQLLDSSGMDCKSWLSAALYVGIGMTFTIPVLVFIIGFIGNSFCQAKKRRGICSDSIIKTDGSIDFNGGDSWISKLTYCASFLMIIFYLFTIVMTFMSNRSYTINPALYPILIFTFVFYALVGYLFFYVSQSIVTNIRSLRDSSENCKSYIKTLQQKEPKIVFNYKEMHTEGEDNEIIDFEKDHTFEYSESRDVTDFQQFQDIESKIV